MKIDTWGDEMERESIILNAIHQKQTTTTKNSALAQLGPLIYQNILEIRGPSCLGQVSKGRHYKNVVHDDLILYNTTSLHWRGI